MAGPWTQTNRNGAAAATASQTAPATSGGQSVRCRQLSASLSGTAASSTQTLVVRDGPASTGTIIWQEDLSISVNTATTADHVNLTGCDFRASPGNALTVEFTGFTANTAQAISISGDFVPVGYPIFGP